MMESLSDEIQSLVLEYIAPLELLYTTVVVSKSWAGLVQNDLFWRNHELLCASHNLHGTKSNLTRKQIQQCCIYLACPNPQESLFPKRNRTEGRVCMASTTDHRREDIINVLEPSDASRITSSWWSSRPSREKTTTETLLFRTKHRFCVVSSISTKPLRDPYYFQSKVYSWKKMQIRAYLAMHQDWPVDFLGQGEENDDLSPPQQDTVNAFLLQQDIPSAPHQELINEFTTAHEPVYESPEIEVRNADSDEFITIELPNIIANVILITLNGKNHEQRVGMGYYACVEQVLCHGAPIAADESL